MRASERGLLRRKENERHRTNAINALGYNIRNELKPSRRQPVRAHAAVLADPPPWGTLCDAELLSFRGTQAASAGSFLANELKFQVI